MAYKSLIRNQTKKAFSLLKDLAEVVTFNEKVATGFNFNTAAPVMGTPAVKTVKGVFVEEKTEGSKSGSAKSSDEIGRQTMKFLCKSKELGDPSPYTTCTQANGQKWQIVPPYSDDGYLTILTLARVP